MLYQYIVKDRFKITLETLRQEAGAHDGRNRGVVRSTSGYHLVLNTYGRVARPNDVEMSLFP